MKWLLIGLLLAGTGFAQTRPARKKVETKKSAPAPAPAKWPVESLSVEGNHTYTREQVLAVAGLKIGQMAGKQEFEAARDRLMATGVFDTVGYKFEPGKNGKDYAASFQVTEVVPVYPVRFEDLGVPEQDIENLLHARDPLFMKANLAPTKPVLDRYAGWIEGYLASKGIQEKVAGRVTPAGPDQFAVVFRPARNLPAVAQVTFEGNQAVPQNLLRDAISGVAVGAPYTEGHFRELMNASVRPVYEARGLVRVSFPKIRTEPAGDVQGLHVFVTVDEGPAFKLDKVAIEGPSPLRPDDLVKAGNFKTDEAVNFDQVNEGLERIRKALRRSGYLEAKVTSDRKIDDAKKTVDLALHIEAGPRFAMGKLHIVGLDLNGEFEINRIWAMKEGKPFNAEYPDHFLNRIREQGLFENLGKTKSEIKVNGPDRTADVTLTFGGENPDQGSPGRRRQDR